MAFYLIFHLELIYPSSQLQAHSVQRALKKPARKTPTPPQELRQQRKAALGSKECEWARLGSMGTANQDKGELAEESAETIHSLLHMKTTEDSEVSPSTFLGSYPETSGSTIVSQDLASPELEAEVPFVATRRNSEVTLPAGEKKWLRPFSTHV
jgi:hypothetical protein